MDQRFSIKENRQAYCDFVQQEKNIPLFFQSYWWNNVPGVNKWHPLCIYHNRKIIGVCPVFFRKKWLLKIASNPYITPYAGPWFPARISSDVLINGIKYAYSFLVKKSFHTYQRLDPAITLKHQVVEKTPGIYSRLIQHFPYLEKDVYDISPSLKKDIEISYSTLTFKREEDIKTSFGLIESHLTFKGNPLPFKFKDFERLDQILEKKNQRIVLTARTSDGNLAGVHYVVEDGLNHYALLSGIDRSLAPRGCHGALRKMAKQTAFETKKNYDLCGSSIPSIARANRALGAKDRIQVILSNKSFRNS